MEQRTITQTKIYFLVMNRMTSSNIEMGEIALVSTDKDKLLNYYEGQKADEPWRDGQWGKTFKKDSPLEWFNPMDSFSSFGHGMKEEWVEDLQNVKDKFTFVD